MLYLSYTFIVYIYNHLARFLRFRFISRFTLLQEQVFSTSGLFHYASYAQRHDETDILLRIFDAMPDRHNINRGLMCDLLIAIYSKLYFHLCPFCSAKYQSHQHIRCFYPQVKPRITMEP